MFHSKPRYFGPNRWPNRVILVSALLCNGPSGYISGQGLGVRAEHMYIVWVSFYCVQYACYRRFTTPCSNKKRKRKPITGIVVFVVFVQV